MDQHNITHCLYGVYDHKGEAFEAPPFLHRTKGDAIRSFTAEVNSERENSALAKWPGDYTLFELGTWDMRQGTLKVHEPKIPIGNGIDFKKESADVELPQLGKGN